MAKVSEYNELRNRLKGGDIVFFHGNRPLSKAIQWLDNAYYNHVGIVDKTESARILIIDSNAEGVRPEYLSKRMLRYTDFSVMRPTAEAAKVKKALEVVSKRAENVIKYDFQLILKIVLFRKLGFDLKRNNPNKDICSEFVRRFMTELNTKEFSPDNLGHDFITPQDFIRFNETELINIVD